MNKKGLFLCFLIMMGVLFLFVSASTAFENYNSSKGYCGPGKWAIPKFLSLFNEACYGHDKCYNQCANTKDTKATCDNKFHSDMKAKCNYAESEHNKDCNKLPIGAKQACKAGNKVLKEECLAAAKAHYEAVKNGADTFHSYKCTSGDLAPASAPVGSYKNSCDTINYDANADKVTAHCKKINGKWNNSANRSNCKQCTSQGGELANCDGNIDCINANLPNKGSYKNSCWCCRMDGTTLRCHCNKKGRGSNWTSLNNANNFTDIWNDNGNLKGK